MLALLSPAKSLDFERSVPALPVTEPCFAVEAETLASAASRISANKLAAVMQISGPLAKLNAGRFRHFGELPQRQAIFAFAGDVYRGFEVHSLDEEAVLFAQDHVRILSGLYGLLRPLDEIRPYRLEMGTKWAPRRKNLYTFWGPRIARRIEEDAAAIDASVLINLASKEYWLAAAPHLREDIPVIDIDFREPGPNGLRFNTFAGKRARGMMARFLCEHRLTEPEQLKSFDCDGYAFNPEMSHDGHWCFTRT